MGAASHFVQITTAETTETYTRFPIKFNLLNLRPRYQATVKNTPLPAERNVRHEFPLPELGEILGTIRHHTAPRTDHLDGDASQKVIHITRSDNVVPRQRSPVEE